MSGEFQPGQRLPSERELTEAFGVSRVSVREALRSLEALGMVTVEPGRGCFVTDAVANSSALFQRWISLHSDELLDLLNVHKALDALAAGEAAAHRDDETLRKLDEICDRFDESVPAEDPARLQRIAELDIEFHETIARASGSTLIEQLVCELNRYLLDTRVPFALGGRPECSAREHREVVSAIAAHDAPRAQAAMSEHVESVRRALVEFQDRETP